MARSEQTCGTCKWSVFPMSKLTGEPTRGSSGECQIVLTMLPVWMDSGARTRYIWPTRSKCSTWTAKEPDVR